MRAVLETVRRVAPSTVSVLLCGETGTGKEVVAREIHALSGRRDKPFEVVDCGSLSPTLIASELLGHERGSFTGAFEGRAGAFERADGGTVFLDEIGELPLELQPALLGVLERRRFRRVGGSKERAVDVRVISATHRDLRAEAFRQDLYFRIAVVRIDVPPLRERREDVRVLAEHFGGAFTPAEWTALEAHAWPGNVRELRNVVEASAVMGRLVLDRGESAADAGEFVKGGNSNTAPVILPPAEQLSYRVARKRATDAFERQYFGQLIAECGHNAAEAARRAKMDRPFLLKLLRRHGLR